MIAARYQHAVTVANCQGHVKAAIAYIHSLHCPSLRPLQPVVVQLLEIGLARWIVRIVLMRWIAGPVPTRRQNFGHQQCLGRLVFHQDVVDRALHITRPASGDPDLIWRDQARNARFSWVRDRSSTNCEFDRVRQRLERIVRADWQVQGERWARERRSATTDLRPFLTAAAGAAFAGQHDYARFLAERLPLDALASAQLKRLKAHMTPAGAVRRDVHHPTVAVWCSTTAHQQSFHHPVRLPVALAHETAATQKFSRT